MEDKIIYKDYSINGMKLRGLNINGEMFVAGRDLGFILGFIRPSEAVSGSIPKVNKHLVKLPSRQGMQKTSVIDEFGSFKLIVNSPMKDTKPLQDILIKEVFPELRSLHLTQSEEMEEGK